MRLDHHPRTGARKDGEAAIRRIGPALVAILFLAVAAFSPATATTRKGSTDKEELVKALNKVSSFQSIRGEVQVEPESHGLIQTYYHTEPVADGDKVTVNGETRTPTDK